MDLKIGEKDTSIIAVDFDGTLCENKWPEIGEPISAVIDYVKRRQANGARLILWTNRTGKQLEEAALWCKKHDIILSAVNENLPDIIEKFGGDSRKIFANEYIDDRSVNPRCLNEDWCWLYDEMDEISVAKNNSQPRPKVWSFDALCKKGFQEL